jgi:hypothetical protein
VSLGAAAAAAAGAGAAGLAAGVAIALTALRQGAESFESLRSRHSRASLPPGCTLAQFAMKSERQEARTASRCAWVGCCAIAGVSVSAMRQPATNEGLNIATSPAFSGVSRMPVIARGVQQARFSRRILSLPGRFVLLVEGMWWRLSPARKRACLWLRATSSD